MEVDVSRHYEIYDKRSKEMYGKHISVGMSIMAATMIFILLFFLYIAIVTFNGILDVLTIFMYCVMALVGILSIYFAYDVYGNYLYYKGKWKDPPFAKRSVKMFWRDLKRGRMPGLVLPEIPEGEDVLVFHLIYQTLENRGVVVKISKDEKLKIDKQVREMKERGAQNIEFIYKGNRIVGARVYYGNGRIEKIDRETAETMRFLYVLGKNNHTILRSIRIMKDLVKE